MTPVDDSHDGMKGYDSYISLRSSAEPPFFFRLHRFFPIMQQWFCFFGRRCCWMIGTRGQLSEKKHSSYGQHQSHRLSFVGTEDVYVKTTNQNERW